jgi:hypothetical protein
LIKDCNLDIIWFAASTKSIISNTWPIVSDHGGEDNNARPFNMQSFCVFLKKREAKIREVNKNLLNGVRYLVKDNTE